MAELVSRQLPLLTLPAATHRSARGLLRLAFLGALLVLALSMPVRPGIVVGESMSPALHHGQLFLMKRISAVSITKVDVVIFDYAGRRMVKRVVALPGETVAGLDWSGDGKPHLLLTAEKISTMQSFLGRHPNVGRLVKVQVPPGHLFVVGDWSSGSIDSREFGPVPVTALRGVLVAPLARVKVASTKVESPS